MKALLKAHAEETKQQIANIERSFELLGEKISDSPSSVTKAMAKEGNSMLGKTDKSLVDDVILAGALETEHHEIAVYQTLVVNAEARGAFEVAALLRQNLAQEEGARDKVGPMGPGSSRRHSPSAVGTRLPGVIRSGGPARLAGGLDNGTHPRPRELAAYGRALQDRNRPRTLAAGTASWPVREGHLA